ncbi:MAG TPA: hypothetical protein VE954_21170 [Oligoflexus sp.]|uniref:hypothetical protein n=1 Tax=Oligoflexus sp. TaxID=1971216 RepID=UPI002D551447|nr:hypothetical protein [Oligoflexus sp.]HYX35616.1 hypothetical protein [Oligoflexus sp.]
MQSLISLAIIGCFLGPAIFFGNFASLKVDRRLVLALFVGYFCLYFLAGVILRIFPVLIDPR